MSQTLETLINLQEDAKISIDKAYINFKKSPKERLSQKGYHEARLESLETLWGSFFKTHREIISTADKKLRDSETYFTKEIFSMVEETYIQYKAELKEYLTLFQNRSDKQQKEKEGDASSKGIQSRPFVKLPEIVIPKFSGNYSEWPTFRDLFTSLIRNNLHLDDVAKLQYLKSHLSGEAEQILRYTPVTSANYTKCWTMLENRYDNKRVMCFNLIKSFMNQLVLSTESSSCIKTLLDVTINCMNGLSNHGIDVKSNAFDVYTIYIVSTKLDNETRKLWESKLSNTPNELPKLSELIEFLETRYRALEFLDDKPKIKGSIVKQKVTTHVVNDSNNVSMKSDQNQVSCIFCKGDHKVSNCKQFAKATVEARRSFVESNNCCFNCLGSYHSAAKCLSQTRCRYCKKRHHSLLHAKSSPTSVSVHVKTDLPSEVHHAVQDVKNQLENEPTSSVASYCTKSSIYQVLLATALVKAESPNGNEHTIRALLDQGSQASFITERAAQLLNLKKVPFNNIVSGLGGSQNTLNSRFVVDLNIKSIYNPPFTVKVTAHVLTSLTSMLPSQEIIKVDWPQFTSICLADPQFNSPGKVDMLLGAEIYAQIIKNGLIKGPPGDPIAQETTLGWILSGSVKSRPSSVHCHYNTLCLHAQMNDSEMLKRFWEQETEPSILTKHFTPEESRCEEFYSNTTKRDSTGRYVVKLPFRDVDPKCKYGESRDVALKRFQHLERRLQKDSDLKEKYTEVFKEYLTLGHMTMVDSACDPKQKEAVYLPHHAVIRDDKTTTKVRIVFDASCKYKNGVSLNESLMVGPTIQSELRHIIMRWRTHPIILIADIVKMYRQVKISNDDADFQRVLWRDGPEKEIKDYRLETVTFGTASAPYLAVKTLQQLAHDEHDAFPLASEKVKMDYYVDDLMTGCETIETGERLYHEMNGLLAKGGFELQKWETNNEALAEKIFKSRYKKGKSLNEKTDNLLKILGLTWHQSADCFRYTVQLLDQPEPITKRKVISDISRLFDPMGWISPCIITAKILIQKIWISGIKWDENLPMELLAEWLQYRNALADLKELQIPRWIQTESSNQSVELHGFCDASELAYAAVVYIRVVNANNQVKVHLVTSKTKVSPIKQLSIPRLELCGAVLLAKLLNEVAEVLSISKSQLHAWTDSTIVLSWLNKHPSSWKTFIANRTSNILSHLDNDQWSHVKSLENPADISSRGMSPADLAGSELWFHGPSWLQDSVIFYSRPSDLATNLEEKHKKPILTHAVGQCEADDISLWSKYSTLSRLLRVVAYCRRFLSLINPVQKTKFTSILSAQELEESVKTCIKHYQKESFSEEIKDIIKNGVVKNKSKLKSLNPLLDQDGILRVGGRLSNASMEYSMKHPILLPQKSHFTKLLIDDAHKTTLHGGTTLMLSYLRTKYWIISAKTLVRFHVRKCITCVRHSRSSKNQIMGQLPMTRITPKKPFLHTGVDYAGPINIRVSKGRGNKSYKGYICLFICMTTKAIHLEAISDLTSNSFIAGFKRFVSRRGRCSDVYSDNGSNFVGASRELRIVCDAEKSNIAAEIKEWYGNNNITWHFIPPYAPNFGGLWEANIKSTKHHLKRVIGNSTLTYEEMSTVLAQIEACLNSRPISQLGTNPDDPLALTPGHFLVGESVVTIPDKDFLDSNINTLSRWQLTQRMTQDFWRRWQQEYLVTLNQRYKWAYQIPEPEVGSLVLVKEENLPPARWLMGRILQKHPGPDQITRVVTLKCNGSEIKRSVSKLIILPTSAD